MAKGKIIFKLDKVLKDRGVAKYKLHRLTDIPYDTVTKYCKGTIQRLSVEHLLLICSTLKCKVDDIIEYVEK